MQHPCPYLFVSLSEIASCSAYGNKLFKMKLSPRTKEFLWLSALESWVSQKMIHYGEKVGLKTCFCFLAKKGEICGSVDSCYQPCSWAGQVSSWFLADLSWWGIASHEQVAQGLPMSAAHLTRLISFGCEGKDLQQADTVLWWCQWCTYLPFQESLWKRYLFTQ